MSSGYAARVPTVSPCALRLRSRIYDYAVSQDVKGHHHVAQYAAAVATALADHEEGRAAFPVDRVLGLAAILEAEGEEDMAVYVLRHARMVERCAG